MFSKITLSNQAHYKYVQCLTVWYSEESNMCDTLKSPMGVILWRVHSVILWRVHSVWYSEESTVCVMLLQTQSVWYSEESNMCDTLKSPQYVILWRVQSVWYSKELKVCDTLIIKGLHFTGKKTIIQDTRIHRWTHFIPGNFLPWWNNKYI